MLNVETHAYFLLHGDSLQLYGMDEYAPLRFLYNVEHNYALSDVQLVTFDNHIRNYDDVSYKIPFPIIGSLLTYDKWL